MSQENSRSNSLVARSERVPRPLSNPPMNIQFDLWTSNAGVSWFAWIIIQTPQHAAQLLGTIITDNSVDNATVRSMVRSHPLYSPTRWVSGLRCLAHLHNLGLETNIAAGETRSNVRTRNSRNPRVPA
ncbi:hypothetical protein B0H14DRAFT_3130234 [Mycena olivaceomarginata]|nr:hypothetical protein B0H14DRAFT_3141707 [Mycena olivaceomarginata]KAJ7877222.1 hypothetical protein B0H14DRAFT_3130234 [Mycena olivaceomarginata]